MRTLPFVGRRVELDDLVDALQGAFAGRGSVALVGGEPGIGKTRLVDELSKLAEGRGATVAWGRSWEVGGTPAYWPFTQVLRSLAERFGDETFQRAAGGQAADLAALLPEVFRAGPPVSTDPMQARFRLFEALTRLLRSLASVPIVIALDDLHAADLSSLHLLHFLARELRSMRVLVLGTYREQEARVSTERMELITRIARDGALVPLARLGRDDVVRLVRAELGESTEDSLLQSLERSSEGNPLFLFEMLRLIAGRGVPARGTTQFVPDTVRELIRARLEAVPDPVRSLLQFASVFGREFDEALLVQVAKLAPQAGRECLEQAAEAGLVVESGFERWSFSHILVREVLYASIPAALRTKLHATLAELLETKGDDDPPMLAAIAHHRLLGANESGIVNAVEALLALARRAYRLYAFEDVVGILEGATDLLERTPSEVELRGRCLVLLGETCIRAGNRARGKKACHAAAELARLRGDAVELARAALAYGAEFSMGEVDPVLVQLLEAAHAAVGSGDPGLRARLAARLAAAMQPAKDTGEPVRLARDAIALARRTGDEETLRTVIHFGLAALVDYAEPEEIAPLCEESIALATAASDQAQLLRAQGRMVFASLEGGDVVRADSAIAAYERLAGELPPQLYQSDALMMRAMRALMAARFAEADELVARAREIRDPALDPFTRAGAMFHEIAVDLVRERSDRILAKAAVAPEVLEMIPHLGADYVHAIRAIAHARLGDLETARRHLDMVGPDATLMTGETQGQRMLAEGIALVGDLPRAALMEKYLESKARRVFTWGRMIMVCDAPATRLLGLLARAQGRTDDAIALLHDALERARGMEHVALLPRLSLELAEALLERGTPADAERAASLSTFARQEAERLGFTAMATRAGALERHPMGRPAKASSLLPVVNGFRLSLEGDYYLVEHDGAMVRLKDSQGLRLLETLVANAGREFHVLDLASKEAGTLRDSDSGALLDERAVRQYRKRLEDLREAAREAESFGDGERRSRAEAEIESLTAELARAMGLGGRSRRAGAASERARVNVQRRLRDAIRRIEQELPELGRHLSWAVKTGAFCSYSPDRRS